MKRLFILLLTFFPSLVSAQELHTFSNGEVADAEKINENFEALKSEISGSGGCSAEQDGSSVVITCADGTSGVLASEGTVVVYPEGGIVGETPVQSWPTGTIVFEDNNGVLLAEASQIGSYLVFDLDDVKGSFVNLPEGQVVVTGWRLGERIYFSSERLQWPSVWYDRHYDLRQGWGAYSSATECRYARHSLQFLLEQRFRQF
jgi:hypothetical protein